MLLIRIDLVGLLVHQQHVAMQPYRITKPQVQLRCHDVERLSSTEEAHPQYSCDISQYKSYSILGSVRIRSTNRITHTVERVGRAMQCIPEPLGGAELT